MKPFIYGAAVIAALITVLGSRLLIPALIICFKAIEQSFAPNTDVLASTEPELLPMPVTVVDAEPKAKPRKARRRKPSAKTLASIQAIA